MALFKNSKKGSPSNSPDDLDPNKSNKRRQQIIGFGIIFSALIVGLYVAHQRNVNQDSAVGATAQTSYGGQSRDSITKSYDGLSVKKDARDVWMVSGIQKIDEIKKRQDELKRQSDEKSTKTKEEIEKTQKISAKEVGELKKELQDLKQQVTSLKNQKEKPPIVVEPKKPESKPVAVKGSVVPSVGPKPIIVKNRFFNPSEGNRFTSYQNNLPRPAPPSRLKTVSLVEDVPKSQNIVNVDKARKDSKNEFHHVSTYTPAGTFFSSVILGGVDAPTGGQAQDHPYPMLLMVDGMSFLPNKYRYNMKQCMVLVSSYGVLSDERAIGRTEKISCIDKKGRVYERKINGYLVGEDGKNGIKGRKVSKQKDVLIDALIAGIGSGIGSAFQQQSMSYSTSALGSVATIDPAKIGVAGLGSGVNKALDRLSQYYITLAEKMFPVIEIDAGRMVDVVLTSGIDWEHEDDGDSGSSIQAATQNASTIVNQALSMAPTQSKKTDSQN